MKNDVTMMRVIISLITLFFTLLSHLLFSSRPVPITLILNPNCPSPSLCPSLPFSLSIHYIHTDQCMCPCTIPFSLSLSLSEINCTEHFYFTNFIFFFTLTNPLLIQSHLLFIVQSKNIRIQIHPPCYTVHIYYSISEVIILLGRDMLE